jgi:hypothetical protein
MAWIYQAKKNPEDFSQKLTDLTKKYQSSESNRIAEEGEDLSTMNKTAMMFSYLRYADLDIPLVKSLNPSSQSSYVYPSIEPDNDTCRVFIPLDEGGTQCVDYSGFKHHANIRGVPRFGLSAIDRYNSGGNMEYVFDGRSTDVAIPHATDIDITNLTAFSVYITAKHYNLNTIEDFYHRFIAKSTPNDSANNNYQAMVYNDGRIVFRVKKGGTLYAKRSPTGKVVSEATNEFVFTFSTTNGVRIYFNGVNQTLTDVSATFFNEPAVTTLTLGRFWPIIAPPVGEKYPPLGYSMLWYGTMSYFLFWNRELTSTEVTNLYTNKLSTASRARGAVAVPFTTFAKT